MNMSLHLEKQIQLLTNSNGLVYWGITLNENDISELLEVYHDNIHDASHYLEVKEKVQGKDFTLAITTPSEYANFINYPMPFNPVKLEILGLGMNQKQIDNKVYFGVVNSPELSLIRKDMNLPAIDFHIPLAFAVSDIIFGRNGEVLPKNIVTWSMHGTQGKLKF